MTSLDNHSSSEDERARLTEKYGLIEDTGVWGEVVASGLDGEEVEVRNPETTSAPLALSRDEKKLHAMKMKLSGATYSEIATALGYKQAVTAKRLIKAGMEHDLQDTAKELKLVHNQQLNTLLSGVWARAITGDLAAVDRARALLQDIERVNGIANAQKVEHSHNQKETIIIAEGTREEYLAALRASAEQDALPQSPDPDIIDATDVADIDDDDDAFDDNIAEAEIVE